MNTSARNKQLSRRKVRWWLLVFVLAVSIPSILILSRAYDQLKWEVFHQYRISAEELSSRIEQTLQRIIRTEEARSFGDYEFLSVSGAGGANFVQRSPLAEFPVAEHIPGLIGYFQVDSNGRLSTPTLPPKAGGYADYGVSENEYIQREKLRNRLQEILDTQPLNVANDDNADEKSIEAAEIAERSQLYSDLDQVGARKDVVQQRNAFERLSESIGSRTRQKSIQSSTGREESESVEPKNKKSDLAGIAQQPSPSAFKNKPGRQSRKEQVAVYELAEAVSDSRVDVDRTAESLAFPSGDLAVEQTPQPEIRVRFFDSEIDPFNFEILDDTHIVLFRNVWRAGERFIQGIVIDRRKFFDETMAQAYLGTFLSDVTNMRVTYEGEVIETLRANDERHYRVESAELRGELLYQSRLPSPMSAIEIVYTVTELPLGSGVNYFAWVTLVLASVLVGGCVVIYRSALAQFALFQQQQDFVSAVSHELKTPLTSIRMYSEILESGWADDEKKKSYYTFIHDESERLSRLIANVLQLSRISRGNSTLDAKAIGVAELIDVMQSKIASQIDAANFELVLNVEDAAFKKQLMIDVDAFSQIMINLVDNALKFTSRAALKQIDISCVEQQDGSLKFTVRDYGNGIAKDQMRKIFELFYRPEGELTRETVGTGIGLALVSQLVVSMGGKVDVRNCDPGAEFSVTFPVL